MISIFEYMIITVDVFTLKNREKERERKCKKRISHLSS